MQPVVMCLLLLGAGGQEGAAKPVANPGRGHGIGRPPVHVTAGAFSPDGKSVLVAYANREPGFSRWDTATWKVTRQFGQVGSPSRIDFLPDGDTVLAADGKGPVVAWRISTAEKLGTLGQNGHWVYLVGLSADGRLALLLDEHLRRYQLWSVAERAEVSTALGKDAGLAFEALSPDGRLSIGRLEWPGASAAPLENLTHAKVVGHVRPITPKDRELAIYEVRLGTRLAALAGTGPYSPYATFSPDGRLIATAGTGRSWQGPMPLILWDVATGRELRRCEGPDSAVRSLAFTFDSKRLVCLTSDRAQNTVIDVWDVATGRLLTESIVLPHESREILDAMAASPDGRFAFIATRWRAYENGPFFRNLCLCHLGTPGGVRTFTEIPSP